jgi:transposase
MPARALAPTRSEYWLDQELGHQSVVLGVPRYSAAASSRAGTPTSFPGKRRTQLPSLAERVDVVIGVDTHKHTHTAAVVSSGALAVLEVLTVPATPEGYEQLCQLGAGQRRAWSIEGTASYGAGLARSLQARGEQVIEMDHPNRTKRRNGVKNDHVDAVRAAKEALGRDKLAEPRAGAARDCLAAVCSARASAVEAAKQARTQFQSLVVSGPDELRARLGRKSIMAQLKLGAELAGGNDAWAAALGLVARRALALYAEARSHEETMRVLIKAWRPDLLEREGVGPVVAATMLCAWSHPGRCRSEAAFATLAGTAPIDASTGQSPRRRLSRYGDRQLNRALHTVVLTRWRTDPGTQAYVARRRAEGKSDREIRRCLKRYVARSLFRLLENGTPGEAA